MPYDPIIKREHINLALGDPGGTRPVFRRATKRLFPLPFLPFVMPNLVMGLALTPRPTPMGSAPAATSEGRRS